MTKTTKNFSDNFNKYFYNKQFDKSFEWFIAYYKKHRDFYEENKETFNNLENIYKNIDEYSEDFLYHKTNTSFCEGKEEFLYAYGILTLIKNPESHNAIYLIAKQNYEDDRYNATLNILELNKHALNTVPKYIALCSSAILAKIYEDDIQGEQKEELKKKALKHINKAIELAPNDVEYTLQLARYYGYADEDYQIAIETYTKAIEIDPENSYFYSNRAEMKEKLKDYDGAIEDYQKCLEMDPMDYMIYWSLAEIWREQNKNDYATEQLQKAIKENKNRPKIQQEIYRALAFHYEQINEKEKALEIFNYIKNNFPEIKLIALTGIADLLNKLERYEEAIETCEIIIAETNPEYEYVYSELYNAYSGLQKYDKALECAEKLIQMNPKSAYENRRKADALFNLKKYPEAIKAFKQTIKFYKDNNDKYLDYFCIALAYQHQKKIEKAIEYYQKAIEGDIEYFGTYFNLTNLQMCKKRYKEAIQNIQKSIEINPEYADSYVLLGQCYFNIKKYKKAFDSFDKTIELDPQNKHIYLNYGGCYFLRKKYNKALEMLEKDVQIQDSEDILAAIYYLRGMVYEKLKDKTKAKANYAKALEIYPEFNVRKFKKNLFNH